MPDQTQDQTRTQDQGRGQDPERIPGESPNANEQDRRTGGYGGSAGGQEPAEVGPEREEGASAVGRENPAASPVDADEALGNRTGGYGGNPPSTGPDRSSGGR